MLKLLFLPLVNSHSWKSSVEWFIQNFSQFVRTVAFVLAWRITNFGFFQIIGRTQSCNSSTVTPESVLTFTDYSFDRLLSSVPLGTESLLVQRRFLVGSYQVLFYPCFILRMKLFVFFELWDFFSLISFTCTSTNKQNFFVRFTIIRISWFWDDVLLLMDLRYHSVRYWQCLPPVCANLCFYR